MKKLLYIHQGLGDLLTTNGLVHELARRWDAQIILPIVAGHLETARYLYADTPRIEPVLLQGMPLVPECGDWQTGAGGVFCLGGAYMATQDPALSCDQMFYRQAGVEDRHRWDSFVLPRDEAEEYETMRRLTGEIQTQYAYVHVDITRPDCAFTPQTKLPIIWNDPATPIQHLGKTLERAAELHVFDSCVRCLAEAPQYDMRNTKLFWYTVRGTLTHFTRHPWQFIN